MAETSITILKKQRSQIKASLTRAINYIKSLDLTNADERIAIQLESRLEKITPLFEQFNDIQSQIEILSDLDSNEDDEIKSFEDNYFLLIAELKTAISSLQPVVRTNDNIGVSSSDAAAILASQARHQHVKLPTIQLPHFNGQYNKWLEFKDAFNALINSNMDLSEIQKFYYLRSSLQKEALQVIENIQVSAVNYNVAWELLNERFDNNKLIIHSYVKAIFDLPTLTKESHIELRLLYDNVTKNLRSLKALGEPTDNWDTLIIYVITTKLDPVTRREWECSDTKKKSPKMTDINSFLKLRCDLLEKLDINKNKPNSRELQSTSREKRLSSAYVNVEKFSCYYCKNNHTIYQCQSFLNHSPSARINEVKKLKLCLNCLKPNHSSRECTKSKCRKCGRQHNTILHIDSRHTRSPSDIVSPENITADNVDTSVEPASQVITNFHVISNNNRSVIIPRHSEVLLSTAIVEVLDSHGKLHSCRALLDSGAQSNFITQELAKKLKLNLIKVNYAITGVGQSISNINSMVNIQVSSRYNSFSNNISCLVMPRITENVPMITCDRKHFDIPSHIQLADPKFNEAGKIDILLGSAIFWELLCVGQFQLNNTRLTLQKTKLGWVIAGKIGNSIPQKTINCFTNEMLSSLDNNIMKFWQIEEINLQENPLTNLSMSEQFCENHFKKHVKRNCKGQFVVDIPFKNNLNELGNSRQVAMKRFYSQERKFLRNDKLYQEYKKFMFEYESLGHMNLVNENESQNHQNFYLPHHAVVREESKTTKVRVVFDASMKSDSGVSLNDVQYVGPTIQNDLFTILIRFRKHRYVITADISKMYRMVLVNPNQRQFQRIFWRSDPSSLLKCYELNTVTYGTASAPYLAIRCLYQLALDNEKIYPLTSKVIKNDFYVDDCLTGANSEAELLQLQCELTQILSDAGFQLRKWYTNTKKLEQHFQINSDLDSSILQIGENEANKTLGIFWNANTDNIQYLCRKFNKQSTISKRTILSAISQLFDPLGLLGPVVIIAKLLIQQMWQAKISWDESLPQNLHTIWNNFQNKLQYLNEINIPRHVVIKNHTSIELHGFGDASEKAYGACIYVRSQDNNGQYYSQLLCAKSRVSPIKQISLPRLELCSAVLLAQLMQKVVKSIEIKFDNIFFWSDSMITLAWIQGSPNRWKTFVANRVSEIQRLSQISDWHHVSSRENPADLISRGISATEIRNCSLWWTGPTWLTSNSIPLQSEYLAHENIPEQRTSLNFTVTSNFDIFEKYSSLNKLQRVFAYCLRFISIIKNKTTQSGNLTCSELHNSLNCLIRIAQQVSFPQDFERLKKNIPISKKSKLLSLNPIFDKNNLIRVGGRLQNSSYSYEKKHPIILPAKHHLTKLILMQEHIRLLHCGQTLLLSSIRERFWPISGRNLVKGIVHKCFTCFKASPTSQKYLMGNLPEMRINQYIPFYNTGVDYAGPFTLKDRKTRGAKLVKGYICLFICLATKAVHLEAVSDLSTDCFIATLKRFIARRGKPLNIFSDNGTNFVGASAELKRFQSFLNSEHNNIVKFLSNDNISWHFIPARAPNFGGIWEAGIKSSKYHLKRVIGEAHLTFEDFSTVLVQIEAVLNSRPLCPLLSNPDQLSPLTPAHLLIGKNLTSIPEPDFREIKENRLKRYQRLQQLVQHFWTRWHKEYLSELQTRVKWKQHFPSLVKVGTIVLVKEENVPPLKWHLGRIIELHPGRDNVVRVVSLKLGDKIVKRSVTKLCVFPVNDDEL